MKERADGSTATWGDGPRRALLLHGLSSNSQGWWRLGPDLASLGFTVVAPNLRGHGGSSLGDGLHLDGYRDDVLAIGTGWDVVLGHSLGGLLALACQLADPGFCAALVLEDPALALAPTPEVVEWLVAEYAEPIDVEALSAARPRWSEADVAAKVQALRAAGPHVVTGTIEALGLVDVWSELAAISIPTLL
nr:alpha/beta hydrolase [Actinomycetota bacterium]NIS36505.1 alpha/beta hydrolase [Actinomycetota bacterium]NIT98737.1 alpha/beta hydrolase [Actinomycetota bacterium]NIU71002.1 alpha/beta hydrolase [Actinomycetota bacterium]NIV58940.1 alpha/beta fold hydrolase [Actinomycetota bacterium]